MKTGLIMEGGAMRGMYTAGVTDVLMENNITFDGGIGVSAGATFGCNYVSNQPHRVHRYVMRFCKDLRFASLFSLITTGDLYGVEMCYHTIPEVYDRFDYDAFEKNPMEFYVVATDVKTGQAVYRRLKDCRGDEIKWMQGSATLPLVSRIVEVDGRMLLDGGLTDSIPLKFFERKGYRRNVVILTQPLAYRKLPMKNMNLVRLSLRKYPRAVAAIERRYMMYNDTVRYIHRRQKEGAAFVIQPFSHLNIPSVCHDRKELQRVYEHGRRSAEERLDALKEWMS